MVKQKIIVTGGSGFIGTNLIEHYQGKGFDILNIDIKPPRNPDQVEYWMEANILDKEKLHQLFLEFKPDYVMHMAARADLLGKSLEEYETNTRGVQNVIEVSNSVPSIKKVIFASTMLVCKVGHVPRDENDYCPPNLYGESKVLGEKQVKQAKTNFDWTIVRPSSIWGPWFGATYRGFFELLLRRKYFHFSGKMSIKTYGYIGNVVYQLDSLLMSEKSNRRVFYLGDYQPTNIKDWANEISKELGYKVLTVPSSLIYIAALFGNVLTTFSVKFPMNTFRYKNMTTDNIVPLENTKELAPDVLFSRVEGSRRTLAWMKDH